MLQAVAGVFGFRVRGSGICVIGGVWMRRGIEDPHPTPLPGGRGSKRLRRRRIVQRGGAHETGKHLEPVG
jgi:hypothetical protein